MTIREKVQELEHLHLLTIQYRILETITDDPFKSDFYEIKRNETKALHDELLKDILKNEY